MGAQSHKILLLVLAGLLLLSVLSGCGPEYLTEEQVKEEALDYLSSRYSAEFTVTAAEEKISGPSPIPSFKSKPTYWILTAASSQFPNETFTVTRSASGSWYDNYYSLLLNDEANQYFESIISFDMDYLVKVEWGYYLWPDGTDETTTFQEWLDAGGEIFSVDIYLNNIDPSETQCTPIAEYILSSCPNLYMVYFGGITMEGFEQAQREGLENIDWNEHNDWQLEHLIYFQEDTSAE